MPIVTPIVYMLAYGLLIITFVMLNAGYSGSSTIFKITDWQDCRKLVKRGWIMFVLSYTTVSAAIFLNQVYYPDLWGYIYLTIVIFFVCLWAGTLAVMSGLRDNKYKPEDA